MYKLHIQNHTIPLNIKMQHHQVTPHINEASSKLPYQWGSEWAHRGVIAKHRLKSNGTLEEEKTKLLWFVPLSQPHILGRQWWSASQDPSIRWDPVGPISDHGAALQVKTPPLTHLSRDLSNPFLTCMYGYPLFTCVCALIAFNLFGRSSSNNNNS